MKYKLLIASIFAFAAVCGGVEANLIPNAEPAVSGKTPFGSPCIIKNDAAAPGGKTFCLPATVKTLDGTDFISIDPSKAYEFSATVRSPSGKLGFTLLQFNADKRRIGAFCVSPQHETFTTLAEPAVRGAKKIVVTDASAWDLGKPKILAFNAKKDLRDLPNMNIEYYAAKKTQTVAGWEIELTNPLSQSYPQSAGIRMHQDGPNLTLGEASLTSAGVTPTYQINPCDGRPGSLSGRWWIGTAFVKLQVTVQGTNPVMIDRLRLQALTADELSRMASFNAAKQLIRKRKHVEFISSSALAGFVQSEVNLPAAEARQLEFDFKSDKPGYLVPKYTLLKAGEKRTIAAETPISVIPDGVFRPFIVRFDTTPEWNTAGTILDWTVQFYAMENGALLGLKEPVFQNEDNLIPRAETLSAESVNLDALKPRGEYLLEWKGEKPSPGLTLAFLDHHLAPIPGTALELRPGEKQLSFTAPANVVRTSLHLKGAANTDGYPRLSLLNYKLRFTPEKFWRGQWIWDRREAGPFFANVWFCKDFTLEERPEYGAIAVMADDLSQVYVNGHLAGGSEKYFNSEKFDITDYLKKGGNRIAIRVFNGTQEAGLCCDIYMRAGGKDVYLCSDDSWKSHFSDKETAMPSEFNGPVVVLGPPATTPPWVSLVSFRYAGPRGPLKLLRAEKGCFTAEVVKAPPVKIDSLTVLRRTKGGASERLSFPVGVKGEMAPGKVVTFTYAPPASLKADTELLLDDDYLEIEGNPVLASLPAAANGKAELKQARFVSVGRRPMLLFRGKQFNPSFYQTGDVGERLAPAKDAGYQNYRVIVNMYDFWKAENEYDFSAFEKNVEKLLAAVPDAIFMLDIRFYMPEWWLKQNPDDVARNYNDAPRNTYHDLQALGSKKWLRDTDKPLKALIDHIKTQPWCDRIWGANVGESRNAEWFWGIIDQNDKVATGGYSPSDLQTFRAILREKYKTDEALRLAWKKPEVTLDTAQMPAPELAVNKGKGVLFNPETDAQIIDWFIFRNRTLAEAIIHFSRQIKQETDGKWLCGAYYGYLIELATNTVRWQQHHGHNGFYMVAESPYVDFLRGPSRYTYRKTGMPGSFMQPFTTYALHGKLLFVENDERNSYGPHETWGVDMYTGRTSTNVESIGNFNREFGMATVTGHSPYWLDHPRRSFYEKPIAEVLKSQLDVYSSLPPVQDLTPVEVAIVADRDSIYYSATASISVFESSILSIFSQINQLAVSYSSLVVQDLLKKDFAPSHKLYIMLPTLVLDKEQRQQLKERFEREKASVLWLYSAGSAYPDRGPDAAFCGDFFGLKCAMNRENASERLIYERTGEKKEYSSSFYMAPRFYPESGFDRVWGRNASDKPLLVSKQVNGATHYFSTLPDLPLELLDAIRSEAGVYSYTANRNDPLWIGNDLIFLTSRTGGEKRIDLPSGLRMKAVIGPLSGVFESGQAWQAVPGMTYGFLVEKK